MPMTPEELLSAIACLKRDKPANWKQQAKAYLRMLQAVADPEDREAMLTLQDFSERTGRKEFPVGRGLVPFWNQPIPRPEYGADEIFEV